MLGCRIRRFLSGFLLLGALIIGIAFALGVLNPLSAQAAIQRLEEAPGQTVYQSRQMARDQWGKHWQIIAFKRLYPDGNNRLELRLIGFPDVPEIDRTQPLVLTDAFGGTLTANPSDEAPPEPNVGQYDLRSLLSKLVPEIPWRMTVQTLNLEGIERDGIKLPLSPLWIQEWHRLDAFH